jgi:hypothetical protein
MICVWLAALGAASHTRTTDLWKALMCADFSAKEVYLSQNIGYRCCENEPPDGPTPTPEDSDEDGKAAFLPIRVLPLLVPSPQSRLPVDDARQSLR